MFSFMGVVTPSRVGFDVASFIIYSLCILRKTQWLSRTKSKSNCKINCLFSLFFWREIMSMSPLQLRKTFVPHAVLIRDIRLRVVNTPARWVERFGWRHVGLMATIHIYICGFYRYFDTHSMGYYIGTSPTPKTE